MKVDFRMLAVAVAATVFSLTMIAPPASAQLESQPPFRVDETDLNLDKVIAGHTLTATWVFRNDGPTDVNIIRAKPS